MKKIAILSSGGDAPGMNAAIRGVVRGCIAKGWECYGVREGFKGLYDNSIFKLGRRSVSEKLNRGGTFLGSARFPEFAQDEIAQVAVENLRNLGIDYVVVIGGDGTYKGGLKLVKFGIKVIALPGTIDNDIASSKFTIGFDTAVNTAVEAIDRVRDTSSSHNRCSVIEVMGRNCGDIALHAGISVGAEAIFTSTTTFSFDEVCQVVEQAKQNYKKHAIIVVTEHICDVNELAAVVEEKSGFETRATVLGHIQRGGVPSAFDRFIASSMGAYVALLIEEGHDNVCVGTTGNKLYYTDIVEALEMENDQLPEYYAIADLLR
ncbi:MAG: 6-phosphofructokinase [Bacilli bacterium]